MINLFLYGVMIVLLSSLALSFFSSSLKQFQYQTYLVQSGSMEPTIDVGDMIIVKKEAFYNINDVITFLDYDERVVTHRILEKHSTTEQIQFKTQGDANQSPDPHLVPQQNVQGKVIFTLPKVGYLVRFSKTKLGIMILIVAPIIIIAYEELLKLIKEWKK